MNKNYIRGRAKEYRLKNKLEKQGKIVIRSAGSHSFADLISIDKKNKNKLICKDCVSKKCIECRGDIDKNNQYMNKNSFVYYFEPHVPENEHYGYDPATNKEGISLCGDCKTKTHKVCRRCGTDKIGYNRKTGECYYYCYKCREINKDNYTKNQRIKELTELYGFS